MKSLAHSALTQRMLAVSLGILAPDMAVAHVSERALVMLLPTDIYIPAGVAAVAASVLILAILPARWVHALTRPWPLGLPSASAGWVVTSCLSTALLFALLALGWFGPRDPLGNLLPLGFWTLFFVGFPILQLLFGDLWHWLNPWTGLYRLARRSNDPPLRLPAWVSQWPAVLVWLAFAAFLLADPAPDDPARLAVLLLCYWLFIMAGLLLFGPNWLDQAEAFTLWLALFAALALVRAENGRLSFRLPGARLADAPTRAAAGVVFIIVVLGAGSFDGLNETFWWLAVIDVNPLEFPGRSAIIGETVFGLVAAISTLSLLFALCVLCGLLLIGEIDRFGEACGRSVLSLVPIAVGYHLAHFLTVILVNGQYALAAISDPLANGTDLLGLGTFYVTTSFFNVSDTVRVIWLTQAGAVVVGHIVGVFAAHAIALDLFGDRRRAALSQLPLAALMVLYTLFGLWLLASPTVG